VDSHAEEEVNCIVNVPLARSIDISIWLGTGAGVGGSENALSLCGNKLLLERNIGFDDFYDTFFLFKHLHPLCPDFLSFLSSSPHVAISILDSTVYPAI